MLHRGKCSDSVRVFAREEVAEVGFRPLPMANALSPTIIQFTRTDVSPNSCVSKIATL